MKLGRKVTVGLMLGTILTGLGATSLVGHAQTEPSTAPVLDDPNQPVLNQRPPVVPVPDPGSSRPRPRPVVPVPDIGGGGAGSIGMNGGNSTPAQSPSTPTQPANGSNTASSEANNSFATNATSQSTSSSNTSGRGSTSSSSSRHYSKKELLKLLDQQYEQKVKTTKDNNAARVKTNDAKGAQQLAAAYHTQVKTIKAGKLNEQERNRYVAQQKVALQKALSQRLATLQSDYDQGQKQVTAEVQALPDDHAHDRDAMILDGALADLDYQLSKKSNRAYVRYNRAVNELLARTANVKKGEQADQLKKAKTAYRDNLDAVDAVDPGTLTKANKQRLKDLKQQKQTIKAKIEDTSITTPAELNRAWN